MMRLLTVGVLAATLVVASSGASAGVQAAGAPGSNPHSLVRVGDAVQREVHEVGSRPDAALSRRLPLSFIRNAGQVRGPVDYYTEGSRTSVYFTPSGVTFALNGAGRRWIVKLAFLGERRGVHPIARQSASRCRLLLLRQPGPVEDRPPPLRSTRLPRPVARNRSRSVRVRATPEVRVSRRSGCGPARHSLRLPRRERGPNGRPGPAARGHARRWVHRRPPGCLPASRRQAGSHGRLVRKNRSRRVRFRVGALRPAEDRW